MADVWVWLTAVLLALHAALLWLVLLGLRRLPVLARIPDDGPPGGRWPRLSIVVAARDEEQKLERAMRSLLALDYPDVEILAVDDRSTDRTGEILDRLAAGSEGRGRLRVLHVRELPAGWLGKNHALHRAATESTGELILFTDADVEFAPHALRKAVRLLTDRGADHLTVLPDIHMPGPLLTAFGGAFTLFFTVFTRPWDVPDPKKSAHVGIGAFNLVRAAAWRAVGGHEPIRMRPDDDLMLAKLLKLRGFRPLVAAGFGEVAVEWYASVGELVRGLEKNMFAGVGYSVTTVLASSAAHLAVWEAPFVLPFVLGGAARWIAAATLAVLLGTYVASNRWTRTPWWSFALLPVTGVLFLTCFLRSTGLALARGGIDWRGTRYPLAELRANRLDR